MSSEIPIPALNSIERRILGVLAEKAKTTPDAYPLSLNSLVLGCNQKSNRDPVLSLTEIQVEDGLASLLGKGLATVVHGGRVERWKHELYDQWKVSREELAILTELLLREPQTEGELRTRAARMDPIDTLDHLRAILKPLVERKMVYYLTPEKSRGAMLTHGFHGPQEMARIQAKAMQGMPERTPDRSNTVSEVNLTSTPASQLVERVEFMTLEIEDLKNEIKKIHQQMEEWKQLIKPSTVS